MKRRLLLRKLSFLKRLLKDDAVGVGAELLRACADDVGSLCLVKECVELEEMFGCVVVDKLLQGDDVDIRYVKKDISQKDRNMSIQKFKDKAPLIAEVAERSRWPRIWDGVLEHSGRYTAGLQALTRLMSHHGRGRRLCPFCEDTDLDVTILEHVLSLTAVS